ncbi:hypothetical protein SSE37_05867 [Sagittula stellata E-37]|uniref:Uncharacterized protein n=1 Tax=Sagittula stellata (strain ATCC 700073 / DSM 11524 / E-37) TaxID=388399 RepID=A3K9L4_SAGS3|nr:hypothetical protein SSE37_05867 [Sagittula stellata E-37]
MAPPSRRELHGLRIARLLSLASFFLSSKNGASSMATGVIASKKKPGHKFRSVTRCKTRHLEQ